MSRKAELPEAAIPYVDLARANRPFHARFHRVLDRVLEHGLFVEGPEVELLETRLAETLGVPEVLAVASGTGALELSLLEAGVGAGDEVITVSHSFFASANAIRIRQAAAILVDIEEERWTLDPERLVEAIGPRTKAVICVHLAGIPAQIQRIAEICETAGVILIEDCAQAFGAKVAGRSVGSFGTGCFSFHPLKALSALGDAGAIVPRNSQQGSRLRALRDHGLVDRDHLAYAGTNCRMDTLQAAFLLAKLEAWQDQYTKRKRIHERFFAGLLSSFLRPAGAENEVPAFSVCCVRHPRRDAILRGLAEAGIGAKVHYPVPIHRQSPYISKSERLPVTDRVVAEIISLPVHDWMTESQVARVIDAANVLARSST